MKQAVHKNRIQPLQCSVAQMLLKQTFGLYAVVQSSMIIQCLTFMLINQPIDTLSAYQSLTSSPQDILYITSPIHFCCTIHLKAYQNLLTKITNYTNLYPWNINLFFITLFHHCICAMKSLFDVLFCWFVFFSSLFFGGGGLAWVSPSLRIFIRTGAYFGENDSVISSKFTKFDHLLQLRKSFRKR